MNGICQSCGKKKEALRGCPICGAVVCSDCFLDEGCKICRGRVQG